MRIALVCLVVLAALAVSDTTAAPRAQLRAFEAYAVPRRIETHLLPPGRSGDRDLLRWIIRDRHGRTFGVAVMDCNWTIARQCVGVFRLARGTFAVSGAGQTRAFGEFLIVGGTGDYTTSGGVLRYNATSRGKLVLTGAF